MLLPQLVFNSFTTLIKTRNYCINFFVYVSVSSDNLQAIYIDHKCLLSILSLVFGMCSINLYWKKRNEIKRERIKER